MIIQLNIDFGQPKTNISKNLFVTFFNRCFSKERGILCGS